MAEDLEALADEIQRESRATQKRPRRFPVEHLTDESKLRRRGRPSKLSPGEKHEVRRYREAGVSIARLASMWQVSTTRIYEILAEQRAMFGPEQLPKDKRHLVRKHLFTSKKDDSTINGN